MINNNLRPKLDPRDPIIENKNINDNKQKLIVETIINKPQIIFNNKYQPVIRILKPKKKSNLTNENVNHKVIRRQDDKNHYVNDEEDDSVHEEIKHNDNIDEKPVDKKYEQDGGVEHHSDQHEEDSEKKDKVNKFIY